MKPDAPPVRGPMNGSFWTYEWIYPPGRGAPKKRRQPRQGELRLDPKLKRPKRMITR